MATQGQLFFALADVAIHTSPFVTREDQRKGCPRSTLLNNNKDKWKGGT